MNVAKQLILLFVVFACAFGCTQQAKENRHLKAANQYFATKDFKKSEIEYLNVLRYNPTNSVATRRLASIYLDRGQFDKAVPVLLFLRQRDPNDAEARLKLAQFYVTINDPGKARSELAPLLDGRATNDEALLIYSDTMRTEKDFLEGGQLLRRLEAQASPRVPWNLAAANLSLRQTNFSAAEALLQKASRIDPRSSQAAFAWGNFYWAKQDLKMADQSFQKAAEMEPIRSPLRMRWVEFKLRNGATNEAREILQKVAEEARDFTPAWISLARLAYRQSNFLEASNLVKRVLLQEPASYEGQLLQAQLDRVGGRPAEAVRELEQLKKKYPRSVEVHFENALAHLQARNRLRAVASLQETLKLAPNLPSATLLLAQVNIELGKTSEAIPALRDLIMRQPEIGQAYFLLASAYTRQNRLTDALTVYEQVGRSNPTNALAPFYSGLTYRLQNRAAEARLAFDKAIALAPDDPMISYQVIGLDLAEKNYDHAMNRVRVLMRKPPLAPVARYLEGTIFLAQTNLSGAESSLKKAIEGDPTFTSAYTLLAQVYLSSKQTDKALENLGQSLKNDPRNVATLMLMGTILEQSARYPAAAEKYRQALEISPQFAPALNNLGYLLAERMNKLDEGYGVARTARELAPEDPSIADTLGWIHFRRKEFGTALVLLQEAATKLQGQAEVLFHFGMANYMMLQEEAAKENFKRSLAAGVFAGSSEARQRLEFLEKGTTASTDRAAVLQEMVRTRPDDIVAWVRLAGLYQANGAPEKARKAYEHAHQINPGSPALLLRMAEFFASAGVDPKQALVYAREARKMAPEDPMAARLLGRLAYRSGDPQWASSLLEESVRKNPEDADVQLDLANAYFSLGKIAEAEKTARRAAQSRAGSRSQEAQSLVQYLSWYNDSARRWEAREQIPQLLRNNPDSLPVLALNSLLEEQRGRTNESRVICEKILGRYPQFLPAKKQLAVYYAEGADQKKAWDYANEARRAFPSDPEIARVLGKLSFRKGDFRNALRFLQESSNGDDSETLYLLGLSHYELKQKADSQRFLSRALKMSPDAVWAEQAKNALAKLNK